MRLSPEQADFGWGGMSNILDKPLLQVCVLPPEPLAPVLDFDAELVRAVLPDRFAGTATRVVSLLASRRRAADAACNFSAGEEGARAYVAIRRDGGAEAGAGSVLVYKRTEDEPTLYRLFVIVHVIRQAIDTQTRLIGELRAKDFEEVANGPFEIVVALPKANGGVLAAYEEGWTPAERLFDDAPVCRESNALVRVEVDRWPDSPGATDALIQQVCGRVSDAFNDHQRRFLVPEGPKQGELRREYA